ncbi:MAG: 3-keto-disaccharide hydrolase [Aeoliella sp.]
MITWKWSLLVVAIAVLSVTSSMAQFGGPRAADYENGWISLGVHSKDFGWQQIGEAEWTQDENKMVSDGKSGWLMTTCEWANFEMEIDFRCLDPNANSGVFIRSSLEPSDPKQDCYEINISPNDNPFPTGSLVGRQKRDESAASAGNSSEFRRLRIVAEGGHIQVFVAHQLVVDYTDPNPIAKGHIGLQSREGVVQFKRLVLRPLNTKTIFNGKDLTGWKTDRAGPAKFEVTDEGELHVTGGSGQVESEVVFGNFVMQFDCQVNGDGLNSGVFFRSIPGDRMNGYECQIHNGFKEGDRTKPSDFGTGGIYRRTPARLVNARDHEWFHTTIHANGPHFAIWVNGIQVTDWTDTRDPHDNPRSGLRLKPGTFCIQAHDPTTDLLFRNIRVVELP